ncbi:hypothetical protein EIMP300_77540 [Escherichia coli]|uniref:Motility protein B-like N-terminal domain-containing protein n=1 Tax=Escherichia coli TaxID=562 RepID=A0A8S0G0Y8_ECOLX|nr:hypothetical protein EIMP300_77540 [Escherichia coli]
MRKTGNHRERGAKTTIVRRQIKKNHAGHHGGAWKVAFADFTLAMIGAIYDAVDCQQRQ